MKKVTTSQINMQTITTHLDLNVVIYVANAPIDIAN